MSELFIGQTVNYIDHADMVMPAIIECVNEDGTLELAVWAWSNWQCQSNVRRQNEKEYVTTDCWRPVGGRRTSLDAMKESVAEQRLRELTAALKPVMKKDPELLAAAYGSGRHLILREAYKRAREFLGGRK